LGNEISGNKGIKRNTRARLRRWHGVRTGNTICQSDEANPEQSRVEVTIKAASVNTDNEQRDKDLRSANFFDVEKFPEMTWEP
jgi:polyisoprenoid-binding protein YceI